MSCVPVSKTDFEYKLQLHNLFQKTSDTDIEHGNK